MHCVLRVVEFSYSSIMVPLAAGTHRAALALTLLSARVALVSAVHRACNDNQLQPLHDQARLNTDLLCSYSSNYRPVIDHKKTVTVQVGFVLKYIRFEALQETFTIHSWVSLTWQDEFLKWEPANYGGLNKTLIESQQIWTPNMMLFNADASKDQTDTFYTTCKVMNNGMVTCVPHMAHSGICRTTLARWPYDTQNCTLNYGSWMHTGEQINFTFDSVSAVDTSQYQDGPGWRLLHVAKKRFTGIYQCCPNETYVMLRYTFVMQREAAGPTAIVVVPSIAIVMLTLLSLMLDIKGNTRVIVCCSSLFSHLIFLTQIGYDIPKESSTTPIILLFIRDSMIITLVVLLLTLVLQALRKRTAQAPGWLVSLNRLATSGPAKYAVFTDFDPELRSKGKEAQSEDAAGRSATDSPKRVSEWLQLSNILNSGVFILSLITYVVLIICYIPRDDE